MFRHSTEEQRAIVCTQRYWGSECDAELTARNVPCGEPSEAQSSLPEGATSYESGSALHTMPANRLMFSVLYLASRPSRDRRPVSGSRETTPLYINQ